jgi:hypothetical protein
MYVYVRKLKSGLQTVDFYRDYFLSSKDKIEIKTEIYNILVKYGKVATQSDDSISNMNNINFDVKLKNSKLCIDVEWGKSENEKRKFDNLINEMRFGSNEVPSISQLTEWVKGKREFFERHPNILSTRAYFYNRGLVFDDREYAELLQQKIMERGTLDGKHVFKGQAEWANFADPIAPVYGRKNKDFYEAIDMKVMSILHSKWKGLSQRHFERYMSNNKGSVEYVALYSNKSVAIVSMKSLSKKKQKLFKVFSEKGTQIDTDREAYQSFIQLAMRRARWINNLGAVKYKSMVKAMQGFLSSENSQQVYSGIKRTATNSLYRPIKSEINKKFK